MGVCTTLTMPKKEVCVKKASLLWIEGSILVADFRPVKIVVRPAGNVSSLVGLHTR
jgi:hypothetical protein